MSKEHKLLSHYGERYCRIEFKGYKYRAKVSIQTTDSEHSLDIYTTNPDQYDVEQFLMTRASTEVTSINVIHWATKEQDDLEAEFIDEYLTKTV